MLTIRILYHNSYRSIITIPADQCPIDLIGMWPNPEIAGYEIISYQPV